MILFHNLEFYDKSGNNLNLERIVRVTVDVEDLVDNPDIDPHGTGAKLEAITNWNGQLEEIRIIAGGSGYTDNTKITVNDTVTKNTYIISGNNFIIKDVNGSITAIVIPIRKNGFSFPCVVYKGNLFFNNISVGLIESEHIYVTERVKSLQAGEELYSYPKNTYFSDGTYIDTIHITTDEDDSEIFLYDVDNKTAKNPLINKYSCYDQLLSNGLTDALDGSYTRIINHSSNSVMQINVAVRADEEGIYENFLRLQVINNGIAYSFAEILFRAEITGEDERLRYALDNFGFNLSAQDVKIFRDSDINEDLPNYLLLNEKRKEMLLEYSNIFPYIGSYKGLVNILKYFDYADLRLKEYWLNTEMTQRDEMIPRLTKNTELSPRAILSNPKTNEITINDKIKNLTDFSVKSLNVPIIPQKPKNISDMLQFYATYHYIPNYKLNRPLKFNEKFYKQVDIPIELKGKGRNWQDEDFLPSNVWKKTSLFSLHYDINKVTDETDIYGIPEVTDSFMFSEEEALIKLFALKQYLKDRFLPLNARIIDIVGEGVYFTRYSINSWNDNTKVTYINKLFQPDFDIVSSFYIEDLQDYGHIISNPSTTNPIVNFYGNAMFNFMNANITAKNNLGPVGCLVNLNCDNFDLSWDECNISWDELIVAFNDFVKFELTDIVNLGKICYNNWHTGEITEFVFTTIPPLEGTPPTPNYYHWLAAYNELIASDDPIVSQFIYTLVTIPGSPSSYKILAKASDYNTKIGNILFLDGLTGIFKQNPAQGINTWDTIGQRDFYEIEWRITHEIPSKFSIKHRGKIIDTKIITFSLPFTGKYKIELILYDMTNHSVKCHKFCNINLPEAEINVLSRFMNYLESWDDLKNNDVTWDTIGGDWRAPGISNNVTWDDCDISWDELDIRNHVDTDPTLQFVPNETSNIIRISEANRYVGDIEINGVDEIHLDVRCKGQYTHPKLRNAIGNIPQDYIFFKRDEFIFRTGVISADYSESGYTTIKTQSFPNGLDSSWKCMREIGGTILVPDNITYDEIIRNRGLKPDSYIKLKLDEENNKKQKRILIDNIINSLDPGGISLSMPINKIPNEFGKIYKLRNASLYGTGDLFTILPDKKIQLLYTVEDEEIIPGFTEIQMTSELEGEPYIQRLRVQHWDRYSNILDVIEIDGDLSIDTNAVIEYEYWQFNAKLVHYLALDTSPYYGDTNIELNFNDYPYHTNFVVYTSPGTPGDYILNGLWYFDYAIRDGNFSIEVDNIGFEDNNTLISVNDEDSNLFRCGPQFLLSWSTFNEDYAEKRLGMYNLTWDNFNEVSWDNLYHLQWCQLEYFPGNSCGFEIIKISPAGSIRFNELEEFIFEKIPINGSSYEKWKAATDELNSTDNPGMCRFNFTLVPSETSPTIYKILATAKTRNIDCLGYLIFNNGVEGIHADPTLSHTYPLGNYTKWNDPYLYGLENLYANWFPVARTYYEYGFDSLLKRGWYPATQYTYDENTISSKIFAPIKVNFLYPEPDDPSSPIYSLPYGFPSLLQSVDWRFAEGMRCLYDTAVAGPFNWNDFFVSNKPCVLKPMTTVFFLASKSKIAGKNKYLWQIKDRTNNKVLVETIEKELIWTFSYESVYDISLTIEDINGNKKSVQKNSFIKIVK